MILEMPDVLTFSSSHFLATAKCMFRGIFQCIGFLGVMNLGSIPFASNDKYSSRKARAFASVR
jgi:hypothetical protein